MKATVVQVEKFYQLMALEQIDEDTYVWKEIGRKSEEAAECEENMYYSIYVEQDDYEDYRIEYRVLTRVFQPSGCAFSNETKGDKRPWEVKKESSINLLGNAT